MFAKLTRVAGASGFILALVLVACQAQGNTANQIVPGSLENPPLQKQKKETPQPMTTEA